MDPQLEQAAEAAGVATRYQHQAGHDVDVAEDVVREVLELLGADVDPDADDLEAATTPPPVVVVHPDESRTVEGLVAPAALLLEDGGELPLDPAGVVLPEGLPLGWHELCDAEGTSVPVCVAPSSLPGAEAAWGWQVQLYALRSEASWGIGDLADLATLVRWTAERGGDLVLVNPLHAQLPGSSVEPSPYSPSSRRWTSPLYLRVEDTGAYRVAPADVRTRVDALRAGLDNRGDRIDRDAAWAAKQQALELLWEQVTDDPQAVDVVGEGLRDLDLLQFSTYQALAERYGADWREWPTERLKDPVAAVMSPLVLDDEELFGRVMFHAWLQQECDAQLERVQADAVAAGMAVGVVHDLAVGVVPSGADAWTMQEELVLGARIGAPPDGFNQQGQDWGMPPWHPQRLRAAAYDPVRGMVRSLLRHAGGIRLDHVLGLFRLWWVLDGRTAKDGTFVSYDAEELLGVIMLEAERAGAVVIGEDLGTVPERVVRVLDRRGVLGTTVLWFERDGNDGPLQPPQRWREKATGTVTTHDLPTALGWLRGEHVRVREELGLLDDPAREREQWRRERAEVVELLLAHGALDEGDVEDEDALVRGLHRFVAGTPSRYVLASLSDAVGDLDQPNLPGTVEQYPNWRLPVSDADGRVLLLEELLADPRVAALAGDLDAGRRAGIR